MRTHKPAHIARHAAVVLAGAASLSLTVVAGAYIVHQIAETERPAGPAAAPPALPAEEFDGESVHAETVLTAGSHELPVLAQPRGVVEVAPKVTDPQLHSAFTTHNTGVGGRLRLGDTYIGAQLAAVPDDTISLTVDTNAVTVLTGLLPADPRRDTTAVTRLRTEFDTRSGAVVLLLTDPELGEHDLRIDRAAQAGTGATAGPDESVASEPAAALSGRGTPHGGHPSVTV
ncbi:hypothetical protein [Nocardia brasiliensis]|uniref:hypothetical protein n=1 Tax=Nocardia brasiliensis TaxID=37326 RepID=UPI001896219D|nr:hypothetical protein [Nocardia brasiliensis]MBF6127744.1 hypothetical protein [Nocardia brasiliensis]